MEYTHQTVLLHESIEGLGIEPGDVFVDCTINGGGHSAEVAKKFGPRVEIIGIDMDEDALRRASDRLHDLDANVCLRQGNFRDLDWILRDTGHEKANRFLFDLGLSSNQLEDSGRGFAFKKDEPLLMTFKKNPGPEDFTVSSIVNTWDETHIADIIYGYGEERFARRIAHAICAARMLKPIERTGELAEIVKNAVPGFMKHGRTHPATKTFQAFRIAVNDELRAIREALPKAFSMLAPGGRIAVISFHSLEDRIVKQYFRELSDEGKGLLLTKKPIIPTEEEVEKNPRSRSSKLRIIEKKHD